ncbi:MAG: NAD(+)/NADH kinase [Candidatus Aenigmarchaeota archaeon]|nr:NAD(+)/NADH kinase [Candidatus Aenigmarchaeota archaeon]
MEKVLISSLHSTQKLRRLLKKYGFSIVNKNPDFILVYGGDGSVLFTERRYSSIPKLIIKKTEICRKCDYTFGSLKSILPKIKSGKFKIKKEMKLEAEVNGKKLVALNEIQLHTKIPIRAVRFSLSVNGKIFETLIGDGVVISTPFGSSAYFSSVGGKIFARGIGISFNNLHNKKLKTFIATENARIKIRIIRDNAWLAADNDEKLISLNPKDIVTIKRSNKVAKFIEF